MFFIASVTAPALAFFTMQGCSSNLLPDQIPNLIPKPADPPPARIDNPDPTSSPLIIEPIASPDPLPTSEPIATPLPSPSGPQCSTQILDYGQKGVLATVARGTSSDIKILPGSSWIGVAYTDPGALSLKFAYGKGSGFQTEVVSGDGNARDVKLGFFTSGRPIIIWSQNTASGSFLKAAFRNAPVGEAGDWSAAVLETSSLSALADSKYAAVELAISAQDDLLFSFVSNTKQGWRARFGSCLAPCKAPHEINLIAAIQDKPSLEQRSSGAAWIIPKSGISYPAITYSLEHSTVLSTCTESLENCFNTHGDTQAWRHLEVSPAASVTSNLWMERSKKIEPLRIAMNSPQEGLQVAELEARCVDDSFQGAPCAIRKKTITSDPKIGNRWVKILRDDNSKFHLTANEGNKGISYFNSSKRDLTKAWNTPTELDSSGFSDQSQGGAVFGEGKKTILISYGINAAPYDLRLGVLADPSAPSGTKPSLSSYSARAVDLTGGMQLSARNAQRKLISTHLSETGAMGVAYIDYSSGSARQGKLKFAYQDPASNWQSFSPPVSVSPQQPVLKFDSQNHPWIGYYDSGDNLFHLATRAPLEAHEETSPWSVFEFPFRPGPEAPLPASNETALVFESSTGHPLPMLIVIDNSTVRAKTLRAAHLDPQTGNWSWTGAAGKIKILSDRGATHLSADVDLTGNIGVSYYDLDTHLLMFSSYNSKLDQWRAPRAISAVYQGAGAHLRLHPETLEPMISFYDRVSGELLFGHCRASLEDCSTEAPWEITVVDSASGIEGIPRESESLLEASLDFDTQGSPLIFYPRGQATQGALMKARRISPQSGSFELSTVFEGQNTQLSGTPLMHFALSGWNVAAAARPFFGFGAFFVGPGNWLYGTRCGDEF